MHSASKFRSQIPSTLEPSRILEFSRVIDRKPSDEFTGDNIDSGSIILAIMRNLKKTDVRLAVDDDGEMSVICKRSESCTPGKH
jgi:hypothetical protein